MTKKVPPPFEVLDLTHICEPAGSVITEVSLALPWYETPQPWLRLRGYSLFELGNHCAAPRRMRFEASIKDGVTDFEHDDSRLLRFELINVQVKFVRACLPSITGFFFPDPEEFHVPNHKDEIGALLAKGQRCTECEPHHLVIEQYCPPINPKLFEKIKGAAIHIDSYFEDAK